MCGGVSLTYVWEVLLKADEQRFPREKLRFIDAKTPSPYKEVSFSEINRTDITEDPIEINSLYRFSAVFEPLLKGLGDYPELQECLFDILIHYMAEINMYEGMCKKEYHGLFLHKDIKSGKYGKRFRDVFQTFTHEQIRFVIENMVRLYETDASITLYTAVMKKIYTRSIHYFNVVEQRELLVYIGKRETPELRLQVDFLLSMFVPFDYVVHLFWDVHFGLIGVDETLEADKFMVF